MITYIKKHFPAILAATLVVVDSLSQAGVLNPSAKLAVLINGVLAAFGLGILHFRTLNNN